MENIFGKIKFFDISFYNGQNEKCVDDNGKEYYLLEIREFNGEKCVNMYHKYILCNTIKSMALLRDLLKEQQFVELLIEQPKIIDINEMIKKLLLEE